MLTLHKHACAGCGQGVCRNCSNHFLILAESDLTNFATMEAITAPSKAQRCCDNCFDRIATRKKGSKVTNSVRQKYQFGEKLGEGGFGIVYEGQSALNRMGVAIKCIDRKKLDENEKEAIYNEVRILESLNHPNIVHLFEFFEEPDCFYMILEKISGGELFDRIVSKIAYNEKEARDLVVILLGALKYMHDRNVVHR
jgi:serine/threonine protein kinase